MGRDMHGRNVYCDCGCGQVMAKDFSDRIVVRSKSHGRDHLLVIPKASASSGLGGDFIAARDFDVNHMLVMAASSTN